MATSPCQQSQYICCIRLLEKSIIPFRLPKIAKKEFLRRSFAFELSEELSKKVKAYANASHVTPFMVLLAAYGLLISQYEGANQICIGTTFNGRNDSKWHSTFGMFPT